MNKKKRTAMIVTFTLGAFLFAGTALADILDKSGYDQLKDAIKMTAQNCTENYQSFTLNMSMDMKDNGKVVMSESMITKYDVKKGAREETSQSQNSSNRTNSSYSTYNYYDEEQSIGKSSFDDNYIVTTFKDRKNQMTLDKEDNPFNQEEAKDMERILDALVGSLRDHVIVTENADGSKSMTGNLSEAQIPALINALASFQMKQQFNGNQEGITDLSSDVYVKEVRGTAEVNQEGALESILGSAIVSGVDVQGETHEISLEILFEMRDINNTKVVKPDLKGKKVITQEVDENQNSYLPTPEKFVGTFKNDIIMEQDGKFVKIGERVVEITSLDKKAAQGNYREELKEGFEEYASSADIFTFEASFDNEDSNNATLEASTEDGSKMSGNMYFDGHSGRISLYLNHGTSVNNKVRDDYDFRPDFD
ncbi:hypothetical protein [Dehalobacterium formicoaceticum]|uniref:Uncharacterized protein n=1 Tax=Dehalobacterium formicoaceticum TaxID=51515 RepID=A0ABT1Y3T9_9FIRM|nr:hypothetical protein [Dehalobacterium formicoaceticum]MCR6545534.1 hypothetical protein [Dehalobacterium formicoaceticum]